MLFILYNYFPWPPHLAVPGWMSMWMTTTGRQSQIVLSRSVALFFFQSRLTARTESKKTKTIICLKPKMMSRLLLSMFTVYLFQKLLLAFFFICTHMTPGCDAFIYRKDVSLSLLCTSMDCNPTAHILHILHILSKHRFLFITPTPLLKYFCVLIIWVCV